MYHSIKSNHRTNKQLSGFNSSQQNEEGYPGLRAFGSKQASLQRAEVPSHSPPLGVSLERHKHSGGLDRWLSFHPSTALPTNQQCQVPKPHLCGTNTAVGSMAPYRSGMLCPCSGCPPNMSRAPVRVVLIGRQACRSATWGSSTLGQPDCVYCQRSCGVPPPPCPTGPMARCAQTLSPHSIYLQQALHVRRHRTPHPSNQHPLSTQHNSCSKLSAPGICSRRSVCFSIVSVVTLSTGPTVRLSSLRLAARCASAFSRPAGRRIRQQWVTKLGPKAGCHAAPRPPPGPPGFDTAPPTRLCPVVVHEED